MMSKSRSPNFNTVELILCPKNINYSSSYFEKYIKMSSSLLLQTVMHCSCVWSVFEECQVSGGMRRGVSHISMEFSYFTVFTFKMNAGILSPEPHSLSLISPQFLSLMIPFSFCLLNS